MPFKDKALTGVLELPNGLRRGGDFNFLNHANPTRLALFRRYYESERPLAVWQGFPINPVGNNDASIAERRINLWQREQHAIAVVGVRPKRTWIASCHASPRQAAGPRA